MLTQKRKFSQAVALTLATVIATANAAIAGAPAPVTAQIDLLSAEFPRTLAFREPERIRKNKRNSISYEQWSGELLPYGGIIAKAENEIIPGRSELLQWLTRFKTEHPRKMVLIHYLFRARNVKDIGPDYSAAHWIHYSGTTGVSAIAATRERTEIRVEDISKITTTRTIQSDISICDLLNTGAPDWSNCETGTVVESHPGSGTILVERAQYGSTPRSFTSKHSYIAVRASEESSKSSTGTVRLWFYNFSARAPVDGRGLAAANVLANELGERFAAGGRLSLLDGIAFDVFRSELGPFATGVDLDGDGRPDSEQDAKETYSMGVYRFSELLRDALGPTKLILGEGWGTGHQHNFGVLNGIESEGWPQGHADISMVDWSGGINRHLFWLANGYPANRFNYFVYKYRIKKVRQAVPFSVNRLFMAGAQFTQSAVSQSRVGKIGRKGEGLSLTFLDEAVKGVENKPGWLGQPIFPPVRLAKKSPDRMPRNAAGNIDFVAGEGTVASHYKEDIQLISSRSSVHFRLPHVVSESEDLTFFLEIRGEPRVGRPAGEGRYVHVRAIDARTGELIQDYYNYINNTAFEFSYMVSGVANRDLILDIEIAGGEPVWVSRVSAHTVPDAIYQVFERGIVLANPGSKPQTFDLERLTPDTKYRRLTGRPQQDPQTNDGSTVQGLIVLSKDALFLERL